MNGAPGDLWWQTITEERQLLGLHQRLRVLHGGCFGDGAVVDDHLQRSVLEDDAGGGVGAGEDAEAFRCGEGAGADGDRNLGGGVAVVVDLDCDEMAVGLAALTQERAGIDAEDAEVGQAPVAVDPVVEEPGEVLLGDLFERLLEGVRVFVAARTAARGGGVTLEGLLQRVVADDGAEHPEDIGRLIAVEDVVAGDEQALAGCDGVRVGDGFGLGDGECGGVLLQLLERGIAAQGALGPEQREELRHALVEPDLRRAEPGVAEGVDQRWREDIGGDGVQRGDDQGVVLEGLAGVVDQGERCGGSRTEPLGEQGLTCEAAAA